MVCKQCGATVVDGDSFCSACGAKIDAEETVVENVETVVEVEAAPAAEPEIPYEKRPSSAKAAVGFTAALIGWLYSIFPVSIIGLVFSIMGKRETGEKGIYKGKGFATAGLVFSILGIVGQIILIILFVVFYVLYFAAIYSAIYGGYYY